MTEKQWRDLVDSLPEPMTCPRRIEQGMHDAASPLVGAGPNLDRWEKFKSNGDRVCSYCGSLHLDDFLALVKSSAEGSDVRIEPSDKGYKIYVHRPTVRNAHDGGIKFYMQHFGRTPTEAEQAEYAEARRRSHVQFAAMMKRQFPADGGSEHG